MPIHQDSDVDSVVSASNEGFENLDREDELEETEFEKDFGADLQKLFQSEEQRLSGRFGPSNITPFKVNIPP